MNCVFSDALLSDQDSQAGMPWGISRHHAVSVLSNILSRSVLFRQFSWGRSLVLLAILKLSTCQSIRRNATFVCGRIFSETIFLVDVYSHRQTIILLLLSNLYILETLQYPFISISYACIVLKSKSYLYCDLISPQTPEVLFSPIKNSQGVSRDIFFTK